MPANAWFFLVGPHHHGHGIPADQTLDATLDFPAAGIRGLAVRWNGVDIRRVRSERHFDPMPHGLMPELGEQEASAVRAAGLHHAVERVHPLLRLGRVIIAIRVNRHSILGHSMTPRLADRTWFELNLLANIERALNVNLRREQIPCAGSREARGRPAPPADCGMPPVPY